MSRRAARILLSAAAGLSLWAAAAGCDSVMDTTVASSDQDRQCQPVSGCSGGLLCVSLFPIKVVADGGVMEVMNYTCHAACDTAACPESYGCYTTPGKEPKKVCVQTKVLDTLSRDGGT